jgi:hypothetical protein
LPGQVYERIEGKSIADELLEITDARSEKGVILAHEYAEAHVKILSKNIRFKLDQIWRCVYEEGGSH